MQPPCPPPPPYPGFPNPGTPPELPIQVFLLESGQWANGSSLRIAKAALVFCRIRPRWRGERWRPGKENVLPPSVKRVLLLAELSKVDGGVTFF